MTFEPTPLTRDWDALSGRRDEFNRWYTESAYLLDSAAMLLGDEMHAVHFDRDQAGKDGVLDDHFKVALVEVNPSPFASCTAAIRLFYQQLHEYNSAWVVERAFNHCEMYGEMTLRYKSFSQRIGIFGENQEY